MRLVTDQFDAIGRNPILQAGGGPRRAVGLILKFDPIPLESFDHQSSIIRIPKLRGQRWSRCHDQTSRIMHEDELPLGNG